jgi:hypothetical protein
MNVYDMQEHLDEKAISISIVHKRLDKKVVYYLCIVRTYVRVSR